MRVIQLGFQLHAPYELRDSGGDTGDENPDYFASEKVFQQANKEIYQPFFALLERNTQKYKDLHFSLIVSGAWLEQAEKYDAMLIERLKKLVKMERVELVSVPYYYSLAFFYAQDECAEQVRKYQDQIERLFGVTGRIFALPELIYNDAAGKWAEEFGFAGMLVGGSARALDWRSPNHVYEAAGCEYLRLLVRNSHLSELIERGDDSLLVEKKTEEGEARRVLSVEKFRKMLDLDFLRGGLVNLYFDVQVLAQQRERGVIGFFDELIATWLDGENQKFATAAEACMVETPTAELSIKETVSWRGDAEKSDDEQGAGLVLKRGIENKLPKWLGREDQVKLSELVYGVRRQILASEDEKLSADWRRLTLADYHKGVDSSMMARVTAIVEDLKQRAEEIKKTQAVEISRAYTKKRDRGDVERKVEPTEGDSSAVKVNFGKSAGTASEAVHVQIQTDEGLEVPVRRLGQREEVEAEEEVEVVPVVQKKKTHAVRKIIKKLVIE